MNIKIRKGGEERKRSSDINCNNQNIQFETINKITPQNFTNPYLETLSQTYFIELEFDNEDDFKDSRE